jgi:hypothetical protein
MKRFNEIPEDQGEGEQRTPLIEWSYSKKMEYYFIRGILKGTSEKCFRWIYRMG